MPQSENKKAGPHGSTRILVDYFCFTVSLSEFQEHDETEEKAVYLPQRIEKKFYLSRLEFQDRRGMYGYAYARWYDGIVYAYGSSDTIYIQMSGTGCRTWETTHPGLTWEKWMACVTADHAEYITLWMNNYPRRLLGWRRPADLMAAECAAMGIKLAV